MENNLKLDVIIRKTESYYKADKHTRKKFYDMNKSNEMYGQKKEDFA